MPEANGAIEGYHFDAHKQERLIDSVSDFEVTPDGKTLLYRAGERLRVRQSRREAAAQRGRRGG